MNITAGKTLTRVIIFIVTLILGFLIFSYYGFRREAIRDNEVGVLIKKDGSYRLFYTGDRPIVIPGIHRFVIISTSPKLLTIKDSDAMRVFTASGKELTVECRIIYMIEDIKKVIDSFGPLAPHEEIRNLLRKKLNSLLKEKFSQYGDIDRQTRVSIIAETHLQLNETLTQKGVSISNIQLRF